MNTYTMQTLLDNIAPDYEAMPRGLHVNIYRDKHHTSKLSIYKDYDSVTVISPEGLAAPLHGDSILEIEGPSQPTAEAPPVVIVARNLHHYNTPYLTAYPLVDGKIKPGMFDGSYISCSDSRFTPRYPVPLHDRYE